MRSVGGGSNLAMRDLRLRRRLQRKITTVDSGADADDGRRLENSRN